MTRALGVDLGSRRIGLALSDPSGTIASPYQVLERSGDAGLDRQRLAGIVAETGAEVVVVGLPLSLSGEEGPAAREAEGEARAMAEVLDVPVQVHDERLTTVSAHRSLKALGMRGQQRRHSVDMVAAAGMLQSWLDGGRR